MLYDYLKNGEHNIVFTKSLFLQGSFSCSLEQIERFVIDMRKQGEEAVLGGNPRVAFSLDEFLTPLGVKSRNRVLDEVYSHFFKPTLDSGVKTFINYEKGRIYMVR